MPIANISSNCCAATKAASRSNALAVILPAKVVESARIANTNCRLCADKSNATSRPSNRAPVEHGQAPLDASGSTDTAMAVDKPPPPFPRMAFEVSRFAALSIQKSGYVFRSRRLGLIPSASNILKLVKSHETPY